MEDIKGRSCENDTGTCAGFNDNGDMLECNPKVGYPDKVWSADCVYSGDTTYYECCINNDD